MNINYKIIGGKCVAETKSGKQCRLPAHTIAGGLAVCPYHINYAIKLFRHVQKSTKDTEYENLIIKASLESNYQ